MKQLFDVDLSLKLSPPKYPKGVRLKKRVVLNRDLVTKMKNMQIRELAVIAEKLGPLRDSFAVHGWLHEKKVPTVKVDPNNKDRFIALSAFHRDAAAELIGWDTMIYDVLEFDSPRDERVHRTNTNPDIPEGTPNTLDDIVKQVIEAIQNNEIKNDDDDVKKLIDDLAPGKTIENRKVIFNRLRRNYSTSSTLLTYHSGKGEHSTNIVAEKLNIPAGGDRRLIETGRLGYISSQETPKSSLFKSKTLANKHGKIVEFFAWISTPLSPDVSETGEKVGLPAQRKAYKAAFDEFILEDCKSTQFMFKLNGYDVELSEIVKNYPIKFVGFLPQDITADPNKAGRPKEETIVDVNGNPI